MYVLLLSMEYHQYTHSMEAYACLASPGSGMRSGSISRFFTYMGWTLQMPKLENLASRLRGQDLLGVSGG